jgi:hypothetical protein
VTIAYSQTLVTAGTMRSGYVQLEAYGSGASFYDGGASMTSGLRINTDPYNGSPATEFTCVSSSELLHSGQRILRLSLLAYSSDTGINALTIEANGSTVNYASYLDGASGGSLSTTYNFRFLEADGLTPVTVTTAPEPVTYGLMGAALLLGGWLHRRKRGRIDGRRGASRLRGTAQGNAYFPLQGILAPADGLTIEAWPSSLICSPVN